MTLNGYALEYANEEINTAEEIRNAVIYWAFENEDENFLEYMDISELE